MIRRIAGFGSRCAQTLMCEEMDDASWIKARLVPSSLDPNLRPYSSTSLFSPPPILLTPINLFMMANMMQVHCAAHGTMCEGGACG
jgi:hypothetical protein